MDSTWNILIISVLFLILFLIGACVFYKLGKVAFEKTDKGNAKTFSKLLERGNFLRIITVILIVYSVLIMTFTHDANIQIAYTLLSGVAGYVLGGMNKDDKKENIE